MNNPDAPAFLAPGRATLSYRGLGEISEYVQCKLGKLDLGRNDPVALVMPNGPEMAVAFLAFASSVTVAPLNPAYKEDELEFYLTDIDAKALAIQSDLDSPASTIADSLGIPVIELGPATADEAGRFSLMETGQTHEAGVSAPEPDDIALVLHTSGTTSRPKIVPLSHRNLCASAYNIAEAFRLSREDRCLNVMPFFHIHGLIGAVLSTIAAGGSVVCTPGFADHEFFRWLDEYKPTWYTAVPTIHQAVIAGAKNHHKVVEGSSLRFIRSCSSSLSPGVMADMEEIFGVPVVESYGMTEASHQITSNLLPPDTRKAGSVGVPTGTIIAVMDGEGNILPDGETGEIVIRGSGVFSGYGNNPDANAEAFQGSWFRTGDLGTIDPDGYLFLSGRIKEIINRGGRKISPREVDDALIEHPMIAQALTFGVSHPTLGEDVSAAVVPKDNASLEEREIRDYAFTKLADYKVPSKILILTDIPKGPTGKPQRIGLAEKLSHLLRPDYVPPRDGIQRALLEIVEDVLGIDSVGIYDNFFMVGGDSLQASRVYSRVRDIFQVDIPFEYLFRYPTIDCLAELIAESSFADEANDGIEDVLAAVEDLSEEEAEYLLGKEDSRTPPKDSR